MQANDNYRDRPPPFDPDDPRVGSNFRAWCVDLQHWISETNRPPHSQAAAILRSLQGAARLMARTLEPDEILNGGLVNGVHLDPVS